MLNNGVDVETMGDLVGLTPLKLACRFGHFAVARLLVENGATIDVKGGSDAGTHQKFPDTPLIDAIERGHSDIARWLIEEGADIHYTCSEGRTALWCACYWGNKIIARMLIDRGADVNARASFYLGCSERSTLETAEYHGQSAIVRLLKENGAY
jgi:ankyrin repeat protein